jgi:peroxiredoxin
VYTYLFLGMLFQAAPRPAAIPLLDGCSESSAVITTLTASTPVRVVSSLAGDTRTCYRVTATVEGGREVSGHVLGQGLPAIGEYERQRARVAAQSAPVPAPVPSPTSAPTAAPAPQPAPRLPVFGDFSGLDVKDKHFALSDIKGKLILICFWSPDHQDSARELILVNRLYSRWHGKGLDAVGVSLDWHKSKVLDSMEDFGVFFPNVLDGYGLTSRYGSNLPRTFVLNERHEIVSASLRGKELETTVDRLMSRQ